MPWHDIPGWFDFQSTYDQAVEEAKDGAIFVESGVAFGRSAAYMARKIIESKKNITFYAIDPWVDDWTTPVGWEEHDRPTWGAEHADWARGVGGPFNAFLVKMREHAPEELERIRILRIPSVMASKMFPTVDFIFIDSDHRYEAVKREIECWQWRVRGVIAGHDYSQDFPGVMRAVDEIFPNDFELRGTTWWRRNP